MLKLARRTAQAEKQAARRARIKETAQAAIENQQITVGRRMINEELRLQVRQARRMRQEAWTMGPLAPRRNHAGAMADEARRGRSSPSNSFGSEMFAAENISHWGTISIRRIRSVVSPITLREATARCAWAGTPKRLCLAEGDRVVVMEGPFKGSIGPIKEINTKAATVTIEGVARTNVTVPENVVHEAEQAVQQMESAIPIDAVRLVHPLTDPTTGVTRDVIIRELRPVGFQLDRATRRLAFSRVVPGLNVRIPWPRPAAPPPPPEDQPVDTLRIDAEQQTFVPTLLQPPAPSAVLDELRNRYSRFRTRHDPDYLARKEAEAAAARDAKRYGGTALVKGLRRGLPPPAMRTPLDEFHILQKAARKARGQPALTDEMLEKIGRLMAQNLSLRSPPFAGTSQDVAAAAQAALAADSTPPPSSPSP